MQYEVTKDGKVIFSGTFNEAWGYCVAEFGHMTFLQFRGAGLEMNPAAK